MSKFDKKKKKKQPVRKSTFGSARPDDNSEQFRKIQVQIMNSYRSRSGEVNCSKIANKTGYHYGSILYVFSKLLKIKELWIK